MHWRMVQQIARRRHSSRQTSRVLSPLRSPIVVVCIIAALLVIYLRTTRDQLGIARRVSRDDWRGVRDVAGALLTGRRRASGTVVAHASVVLGALGHLREVDEARREIEGLG